MSNSESSAKAGKSRAELTLRVVVLGIILSVVMGAANVYLGLKAGMTVSASIPAAVMAMLLFKLLFKNSSILEANQVQTCASAGESLAAGIIFTMPAMILIGYWTEFDYFSVSIIALTGGLLGILFMIPMRKVFVVDNEDLAYPEGVACASVLKAGEGEEADQGAGKSLIAGGVLGAAFTLSVKQLGIVSGALENAVAVSSRIFYFGGDLSPMLVAVGFIVRLNVASLIFIGGALSWLVGIPLYEQLVHLMNLFVGPFESLSWLMGDPTEFAGAAVDQPVEGAKTIWRERIRYVGVGAMVVGGFSSLVSVRHGLKSAVAELWGGMTGGRRIVDDGQRDIPTGLILAIGLVCVAMLAVVNYRFTGGIGITVLSVAVMLVMGFFFTAVASYIVGLVGNSNSPVSGMTITAVLVAGGLLWLFNYTGMDAMVATLGIAAIVCCVACTSGDVCNDLKTGSLVGAAPFRQQIMQIVGVCVAAFVMAPVLTLLHHDAEGGIGGEELPAPQASLFAALARGFSGEGPPLPWNMVAIGAAIGFVILAIDWGLRISGAKFRAHLMPIAVGMYLPFGLATPILIGGLIAHFYSRGTPPEQHDRELHRGTLFSSGVIAGEALTAVGLACLAALGLQSLDLGIPLPVIATLSIVAAAAMVGCFVIMCRPKRS